MRMTGLVRKYNVIKCQGITVMLLGNGVKLRHGMLHGMLHGTLHGTTHT